MKFFISKRRIIFFTICILLLVLLLLKLNKNWNTSRSDLAILNSANEYDENRPPNEPLAYKCCTQLNNSIRTNIYFLKTHKTGGSTVQSVLMRFALLNSLDVMNIIYTTYYWPFSDFSIYSNAKTPNGKYHIMASHTRYDSILKSYQYPDTSMVTILRNPATRFRSAYNFFRMDRTTGMSFQEFLISPNKPESIWGHNIRIAYSGYNHMSVDLGFDIRKNKNPAAIEEFVAKIDREFDFVIIMEHMEESLILLANLMGWPLEYVAFLKINARLPDSDSYSLTPQDEKILFDLNHIDARLYNHFLEKFHRCVRQYGRQKLNNQVQQLKIINERFKNRCVAEEIVGSNIGKVERVEYALKNQSDLECVYSTKVTRELEPIVHKIQAEKVKGLKNIEI